MLTFDVNCLVSTKDSIIKVCSTSSIIIMRNGHTVRL